MLSIAAPKRGARDVFGKRNARAMRLCGSDWAPSKAKSFLATWQRPTDQMAGAAGSKNASAEGPSPHGPTSIRAGIGMSLAPIRAGT